MNEPKTTHRAKRGRPEKPHGEFRGQSLVIRLNIEERSFVEEQAAVAGLPLSTYARDVLTRRKVATRRTQLEDKMLFELNRCGVNLHQIVRTLNFGNSMPADISDVIDELHSAIAKVSEAYDP